MKLKVNTCDEGCYPVVVNCGGVADVVDQEVTEEKPAEVVSAELVSEKKTEPTVLAEVIENEKQSKPRRRSLWRTRAGTIATMVVAVIAVALVGLRLAGLDRKSVV